MNVAGACYIDADPARVWAGLMNPELLALCIPGCQQMEAIGDGAYAVKLKVGVGAVSGTYTGTVRIEDVDEPRSFRLAGEGKRPGATVSGSGLITITPEGGGTRLQVDGEAKVAGIIARVGQRLIGSAAHLLMDQFLHSAKAQFESQG